MNESLLFQDIPRYKIISEKILNFLDDNDIDHWTAQSAICECLAYILMETYVHPEDPPLQNIFHKIADHYEQLFTEKYPEP